MGAGVEAQLGGRESGASESNPLGDDGDRLVAGGTLFKLKDTVVAPFGLVAPAKYEQNRVKIKRDEGTSLSFRIRPRYPRIVVCLLLLFFQILLTFLILVVLVFVLVLVVVLLMLLMFFVLLIFWF